MTRKRYETIGNMTREMCVIERLSKLWKVKFDKLPEQYRLDYIFSRAEIPRGLIEIKVRSHASDAYPSYMISLAKLDAGIRFAERMRIPFVIFVQFTDRAMRAIHYPEGKGPGLIYSPFIGGREDRGDWQDREPVVNIPISAFQESWHGNEEPIGGEGAAQDERAGGDPPGAG